MEGGAFSLEERLYEMAEKMSDLPNAQSRRRGLDPWVFGHKSELISGGISGLVSLAVYVWTAAPNVTLLDSGEFIVAAQHFGVPHPTGYPLWTLLAWLFQLLPLGNAAWEINVFSGVCGALAVALCSGMLTSLLRWFLPPVPAGRQATLPVCVGVSFGLLLAFSVSMWSQSVIAEVYSLHALLIGLYLTLLYGWVRNPSHDHLMLWAFFVLALSFSNHHLTLSMAPLPFLLILLLRRRALADWITAGILTLLLGYLGFAILSEDEAVLRTALRLFYLVALGFVFFVLWRQFRIRWKLIAFLPMAVGAGLLPYAYMPLASSTNPPMNWAYTREARGFFYSVNRSQYGGSLSDQSLRILGPFLGTQGLGEQQPTPRSRAGKLSLAESAKLWVGFFWGQIAVSFTAFALVGYFASIFFILRSPLPQRTWIYLLHFAFVLAAFLQPVFDRAEIDLGGWWLQMPYHTYTFWIFAVLSGLGFGLLVERLTRRRSVYFWLAPASLLLPLLTIPANEPACSQRGRWFGWMFGHDMLADLPRGSVMIGGTDPGRFVPTYMIFGESPQAPRHKRASDFDRRDLYIITQNALGEEFYMKYLRDHYGENRPQPRNAFERWLGRAEIYPKEPLRLPTDEQIQEAIIQAAQPDPETGKPLEDDPTLLPFSATLRWIWLANRDQHEFFIEESFPLRWTYDFAEPHGLVYRLRKERLESLPPELVEADFQFWKRYIQGLLANREFRQDLDAQRSFSKLRCAGANIYRHRKLLAESERAFRQALELWPSSPEAVISLVQMLWEQDRHLEALEILQEAHAGDPNNLGFIQLAAATSKRQELAGEMSELRQQALRGDSEALGKLLGIYTSIEDRAGAQSLINQLLGQNPSDADVLRVAANFTGIENFPQEHASAAALLAAVTSEDPMAHFLHARALLSLQKTNEALEPMRKAIQLGGRRFLEKMRMDQLLGALMQDPRFAEMLAPEKSSLPEQKP